MKEKYLMYYTFAGLGEAMESKWKKIIRIVLKLDPHKSLLVSKREVKHPLECGFVRSLGEPRGQLADYRLVLEDGRSIHVREYYGYYEVHWDKRDPTVDPIGHLVEDAPHWLVLSTIIFIGSMITLWIVWNGKREEKIAI